VFIYIIFILTPLYAICEYLKTGCIMKPGSSDQCGDDAISVLIANLGICFVCIFFITREFLKKRKSGKTNEKKELR